MGLFILLSLTIFSEAMVMDGKVKESFTPDMASAVCNHHAHYKDPQILVPRLLRSYCNMIAFTPSSTDRVALRDTGNQLIVTVSCLTKEDMGWYWCGIRWDFARNDMYFTELVVTDNRGALTRDFWSVKEPSRNKNRSCRSSKVVHKADESRMSIVIICILTRVGTLSIISHLSQRRRRQRNRRGSEAPGIPWAMERL